MFDAFVFVLFLLFFGSLSISLIKTKFKNKELLEKLLAANIEKALLSAKLATELEKNSNDYGQEGFVNFLSKSREWAFEYIENVQKTLISFQDVVGGILKNYKDGQIKDFELAMEVIWDSYNDLMTNLPKDNEENR